MRRTAVAAPPYCSSGKSVIQKGSVTLIRQEFQKQIAPGLILDAAKQPAHSL
jgi:hypothetical protein